MKNIKRVTTQLSSDSSIKTTVISISAFAKDVAYHNNAEKIDLIAYDGSLYVVVEDERVYHTNNPLQEGGLLCVVRKGEKGNPGEKGDDGDTPEVPEIRARFDGGKLTVFTVQNGSQRRETVSPDLTGPSWKPKVENNVLSWERSWDKSTPNSINLDVLRPTSKNPILLRTNSDNTMRSDETSGPANWIQWKYEGQKEWTNLISISDLMNLALAGVSVWYDKDDEKYHFGHKRINKASYDVGKRGGQIISAVELDDDEILYDAGPLPFATQNEMNTAMLDIDRIDGILCDLAQQIEDTRLAIPDVSDCIREPIKTINGETLLGSGNILIPIVEKTSDIENDSGFITSADIPSEVSAFNNDAGYITEAALDGYLTKDEADATYQPKGDYLTNADLEGLVSESDLRTINGESLLKSSGVSDDLKIYSLGNVTASASYGDDLGVTVTPTINGSTKDLHFTFTFPNVAPVVKDSKLTITTDPSDAEISINDEVVGTGSYVYEGKVGDVIQVKVTRNAYFTYNEPITLTEEEQSLPITIYKHATTWEFGNNNGTPIRSARFAYNDGVNEAKTIYVKTNTGITITRPSTFDDYFVLEDENGNPVANHYDVINEMKEWKVYPKQENLNDVDVEMTLKYTCDRMDEHTSGGSATLNIFQSPAPALEEATLVITATPNTASISINGSVVGTGSYTYEGHAGDSVEVKVSKDGYFTKSQNVVLEAGENTIDVSLVVHSLIFTTNSGSSTSIHSIAFNATDDSSVNKTVNIHSNTQYTLSRSENFDTYFNLYTSSSYSAGTPVAVNDGVYDTSSTNRDYVIVPKSANTSQEERSTFLKVTCNRTSEHVNDGGYQSVLTVTQAAGEPVVHPEVGNIQFNITPTDATLKIGDSASSLETVSLNNGSYTVTDRLVLQPLYYSVSKSDYVTQTGNVSAIKDDTKVVNINLEEIVVERSIDAWSAETTFSANPTENSYLTLQVDPTNVTWKVTHIPSFTSAKIQTVPGTFVDVTADDTVYDSTKVFRLYANQNLLPNNLVDDFIVTSVEDSTVTDNVTFTQLGAESTEITLTIVPTPNTATVRVSKIVDGATQRVIGSNNVFTLDAGDQVAASVSAIGYQTLTRTETLNTSATWNMALAYLPLTIYFDNADAADVSDASVLERTFNIDAGGTSQGGGVDTDDPGHTNVPGESDIDDGDGTTGTISGTIVSNTSGIGEGAIEAKWGQDWDKSSAPDYQLTFNVTDEDGNAVNWTSVKLMTAYYDDNDQIGKLGRKWILQHATEYNTSSDARTAYINMNLLSSGGSNVLSQSHVIRMVQSGKTN